MQFQNYQKLSYFLNAKICNWSNESLACSLHVRTCQDLGISGHKENMTISEDLESI
jgi:hypothetical protein